MKHQKVLFSAIVFVLTFTLSWVLLKPFNKIKTGSSLRNVVVGYNSGRTYDSANWSLGNSSVTLAGDSTAWLSKSSDTDSNGNIFIGSLVAGKTYTVGDCCPKPGGTRSMHKKHYLDAWTDSVSRDLDSSFVKAFGRYLDQRFPVGDSTLISSGGYMQYDSITSSNNTFVGYQSGYKPRDTFKIIAVIWADGSPLVGYKGWVIDEMLPGQQLRFLREDKRTPMNRVYDYKILNW